MNKNKNNYFWILTSIRRSSSFCLSFLFLLWRIFLWEFSFSIFLPPSCSLQISTEKLLSESPTQIISRIDADFLMWVSVTWDIWWLTRLEVVTGIQFISIAGASLPQRRTEQKFKQSNHFMDNIEPWKTRSYLCGLFFLLIKQSQLKVII